MTNALISSVLLGSGTGLEYSEDLYIHFFKFYHEPLVVNNFVLLHIICFKRLCVCVLGGGMASEMCMCAHHTPELYIALIYDLRG